MGNKFDFKESPEGLQVFYNMKVCTKCILPESFPDISFNENGVCNYCDNFSGVPDWNENNLLNFIENTLENNKQSSYDVLVFFSGGKDSSFALKLLKEKYKLKVLAMTLDNSYLSNVTSKNMKVVLDNLEIDHHIIKFPKTIMNDIYKGSLTGKFDKDTYMYSTTSCGSCIGLVLATGIHLAKKLDIPLVAGGWTPGQMTDSAVLNSNFIQTLIDKYSEKMKQIAPKSWEHINCHNQITKTTQSLINPLYVSNYKEDFIINELESIGWEEPIDTDSCSSNCRLNSYLLVEHIKKYEFHPYVYELAYHVRAGLITRSEALEKVSKIKVSSLYVNNLGKELGVLVQTLEENIKK